jgi:hypothetical protein
MALAVTPPTRPPMTAPRPRSKLGDRLALNVMVDVNSSLATVTILETTADVVPPGAFRVEKLPTSELIVPTWILEALMVLTVRELGRVKIRVEKLPTSELIVPTWILEAPMLLTVRALGRVKDDTASVENVPIPLLIVEVLIVLNDIVFGRVKLDTLSVEAVNADVSIVDVVSDETVKA